MVFSCPCSSLPGHAAKADLEAGWPGISHVRRAQNPAHFSLIPQNSALILDFSFPVWYIGLRMKRKVRCI
jgi:hypothetical protein